MSGAAENKRGLPGEVAALPDGKDIDHCIQCGMCTATCPVADAVPGFSPRQLIARALMNLDEELLASDEIWYCARCQQCVAICRKNIRPGDIITAIRIIALQRGYLKTAGARHTLAFLADIGRKGKLNEALLAFRTLHFSTVKMVPYAMRMLGKGKLPSPIVKKIEGLDEVKALIEEYTR
ncbi:MAG: 4Fe-4S dicluster domain-containing protein [Pseudomonadota bacterium]